jgi:uncharacterized membrane protein
MIDSRVTKAKILYVGHSWVTVLSLSAGSSFAYDLRGLNVENGADRIVEHWRRDSRFDITHMPGWDVLSKFPESLDDLGRYSVIILTGVDSDSLVLYPYERSMRAPMGPNRLQLIREYVRRGGSLWMIGGYFSFTGRHSAANFHRTPVEEALPVYCLPEFDDRVEAPEGVTIKVQMPDHEIMRPIDWSTSPMFTGYNRVEAKNGSRVLAVVKETGDPPLVVWEFGRGRAMAFTSDIAPHWGVGFQQWVQYEKFCTSMLGWLLPQVH